MKTILFAILALSSAHALAVDWLRYHDDAQRGVTLALDLDSLRQSAKGFESDIRMVVGDGRQEFQGRQAVNCEAATFRIWNLRKLRGDQRGDQNPGDTAPEESGPILAGTALSGLQEQYCAKWQEPADVRWKAFVDVQGETFFYDERVEPVRGKTGILDEFLVHLKNLGRNTSLLARVRIACRANTFAIQSGTLRDETRGWLANIAAGGAQTPASDSPVAILMSMLCPASVTAGGKPSDLSYGDAR